MIPVVGVTVNDTVESCPFAAVIILETTDTEVPVAVTSVVGGVEVVAAFTNEVRSAVAQYDVYIPTALVTSTVFEQAELTQLATYETAADCRSERQ